MYLNEFKYGLGASLFKRSNNSSKFKSVFEFRYNKVFDSIQIKIWGIIETKLSYFICYTLNIIESSSLILKKLFSNFCSN